MGLSNKKVQRDNTREHNSEEIKLIELYNSRLRDGTLQLKARKTGPTLAEKIAFAETPEVRETLTRIQAKLSEKEMVLSLRHWSALEAIQNKPNYFITLAMKYSHFSKHKLTDRDYQTKKLYIVTVNVIKEALLEIDPSLKYKRFEEWPFFVGTMEHFDDNGTIVAPHIHMLLNSEADICTLRDAFERHWKKAMGAVHANDIDIQPLDSHSLRDRAFYAFKHSHQDDQDKLDNGVVPDKICYRYRWNRDAIAHDKWMIKRDTFRESLKVKY